MPMTPPHAVKLPVTATIPFECEFWAEDDGWTGFCPQLTLSIRGNNFEEAKKHMEGALQSKVEAILKPSTGSTAAA
jgi:predicted RNase H-like HicB family nuclease